MSDIIKLLCKQPDFFAAQSVDGASIDAAEAALKLSFSAEYRQYVKRYGVVSCGGHEFTGISTAKRLNVVNVTLEERQYNSVPADWYVIEQANIDGIVIWQNAKGYVFATQPGRDAKLLCNSLEEYLLTEK